MAGSLKAGDLVGISAMDIRDYFGSAKVRLTSPFAVLTDGEVFPKFSALTGKCFTDESIHIEELSDQMQEHLAYEPYYEDFHQFCHKDLDDFTIQERQVMYHAVMELRAKLKVGKSGPPHPHCSWVPVRSKK